MCQFQFRNINMKGIFVSFYKSQKVSNSANFPNLTKTMLIGIIVLSVY